MELIKKSDLRLVGWWLALVSCSCSGIINEQKVKDNGITSHVLQDSLVIAHRGTTYWAPEETEAAMRWARNIGADYLEFDLQRSKDGYLMALHDDKLFRTTNVSQKFPDRKDAPLSAFTYEELLALDAGSWFNTSAPDRARKAYEGLDLLTLEDVIRIAEGMRIKRDTFGKRMLYRDEKGTLLTVYEPDPSDMGHRPGIYVETKVPALFPGIEEDLKAALLGLGWYHADAGRLKSITTKTGKVGIANTPHRVILQTFSKESLATLQHVFERSLPTCFLLWRGKDPADIPDDELQTFEKWVDFGRQHGANIIGPSIAGSPNNYVDLLSPEHAKIIQDRGMAIHAYSFDTQQQMDKYENHVKGMFTNRSDLTLEFYKRKGSKSAVEILEDLGY